MPFLSDDALTFVAHLARAHDLPSLYRAFEVGLVPLFRHHSIIASSHVTGVGFMSIWSTAGIPKQTPGWWLRHDAIHPAFPYLRARPGLKVCTMSDVLDAAALDRHPYHREFMIPLGWRHGLALMIWSRGALVAVVAISRTARQGDFSARERALAESLQPLIAATWERITQHSREQDTQRAQELLLSTLPIAALVYSVSTCRVLFHNRAASESVATWRGEAARKRPRKLTPRWLPEEIVAACEDVPRAAGAVVTCPRGGMRAVLRRMHARAHFESNVVLIVFDEDGTSPADPSSQWLQVARTFSPAEQLVANEAVHGLSNADIGRVLGKSALTVKKQLESVFKKARVSSRAELGALYSGMRQRPRAIRRTA